MLYDIAKKLFILVLAEKFLEKAVEKIGEHIGDAIGEHVKKHIEKYKCEKESDNQ